MSNPKRGRSSKWGAACAPCAAAKTRCIRTQPSEQEQCDRCRSLDKECVGQISGPRKKRQPKPSATVNMRTAPPEGELNSSACLTKTPSGESSTAQGTPVSTEFQSQATTLRQDDSVSNTPAQKTGPSALAGPACTCMVTVDLEDHVPVESDETLLSIYRNQLSGPLPFVIIPAGTTAMELKTARPFLFRVIKMVASVRHLRLVRGQSRAIMEHISESILMRSERSLDLLQGILVFIGSYHYHCMAHGQFNNLIRLAVSLVEDLNLSSCPKSQERRGHMPLVRAEEPVSATNEEKRALLGVWYMSSNAGLVVEQLAFTRYTKYIDQCLKSLEDAKEYKTDQFAVHLVHIQRLTERIFRFHNSDSPVDEQTGLSQPSMMACLDAFRIELDNLRDALPLNLKSNHFLACYHDSACLRIFEPLLVGSNLPDAESQSFSSLSRSGVSISEIFSHFTAALKAWIENWLAIPVCSYFYMPQPAYVQVVHGAMMLSRWVRLAGPDAVKLSNTGKTVSQKDFTTPWQPTPALSGVLPCPDLGLPRSPVSLHTQVVSAQILNTLRADVAAQPNLQVDVLGILDIMAARFSAAKDEMAAAQGIDWENNTWDFAAEHLKMKKARVEKWCEIVATGACEGRSPLNNAYDNVYEGGRGAMDILPEQTMDDDFGWVTAGQDWDSLQWESAMFDEIMQDIHT